MHGRHRGDASDGTHDGGDRTIDDATTLRCPQVNCLVGIPPHGAAPERVHQTVVDNLAFAARELERAGIKLPVEPVDTLDIPGFWLSHPDQAVLVKDAVGSANLFLQYDLYHQRRTVGELLATYRRLERRIAHFQVADSPGRGEPGTGEINHPFPFDELDRDGYDARRVGMPHPEVFEALAPGGSHLSRACIPCWRMRWATSARCPSTPARWRGGRALPVPGTSSSSPRECRSASPAPRTC